MLSKKASVVPIFSFCSFSVSFLDCSGGPFSLSQRSGVDEPSSSVLILIVYRIIFDIRKITAALGILFSRIPSAFYYHYGLGRTDVKIMK